MLRGILAVLLAAPAPSTLLAELSRAMERVGGFGGPHVVERASYDAPDPPSWLARPWATYLLGLDDAELAQHEAAGLRTCLRGHPAAAPADLVAWAAALDAVDAQLVPPPPPRALTAAPGDPPPEHVKTRKLAQV